MARRIEPEELRLGTLTEPRQRRLCELVFSAARLSPFRRPQTPRGEMSVAQTNFGALGWSSSAKGYAYLPLDPQTGAPWPRIPDELFEIWREHLPGEADPDAVLVNLYRTGASMGLHRDLDERDLERPVLSVSLGDAADFRVGGRRRGDPTRSLRLSSGDLLVLKDEARLAYHGIVKIYPGTADLVPGGGRLSLTLRKAG